MTEIPTGGFTDGEQLKKWLSQPFGLNSQPYAMTLATRAILRGIPFVAPDLSQANPRLADSEFNIGDPLRVLIAVFRATIITIIRGPNSANALINAAENASSLNSSIHFDSESAILDCWLAAQSTLNIARHLDPATNAVEAIYRVNSILSYDRTIQMPRQEMDKNGIAYANNLEFVEDLSSSEMWKEVSEDAKYLSTNGNHVNLLDRSIWTNDRPIVWSKALASFQATLAAIENNLGGLKNRNWTIWLDWYNARSAGRPAFDLPQHIAEAVEMRIALGDDRKDFWDREPYEINAEIAEWVKAERELLRAEAEAALGQRPAIHQFREVAGKIVAIPLRSVVAPSDFNNALWSELSEKIDTAKIRVASTQVPKHVLDSIDRLRAALGGSFSDVSPGMLLMRSRTLEAIAATYVPDDMRSEVSGEVLALINDLADSLSDFRAVFPEILEIEAVRLAQQIAADNSNVVRNEALKVANIAENSAETDASVTAAFKIAFDEILETERIIEEARDETVVADANIKRANLIALLAMDVRNYSARVLKSAGTLTKKVAKDVSSKTYNGALTGLERSAEIAVQYGLVYLALKLAGPIAALAVVVLSFNQLAKRAKEIETEAKEGEDDITEV